MRGTSLLKVAQDASFQRRVIPVLSASFYCFCSMSMIYANKAVLSLYVFRFPWMLLAIQNGCALIGVLICRQAGIVSFAPFDMKAALNWLPVNVLFVLMLYTSSKSLALISVSILTIFKNLTNVAIYYGDRVLYGQVASGLTLFSLSLQVSGSFLAGYADLHFNWAGYIWMAANCLATAGYVLYLRSAMKKSKLGEFGMVFYNNLLSLIFLVPGVLFTEVGGLLEYDQWTEVSFIFMICFAGIIGFALSLSTFWLANTTSPTTYSVAGALNKIPLAIIGMIIFKEPVTFLGVFSVFLGLGGGIVYAYAKYLRSQEIEAEERKKLGLGIQKDEEEPNLTSVVSSNHSKEHASPYPKVENEGRQNREVSSGGDADYNEIRGRTATTPGNPSGRSKDL